MNIIAWQKESPVDKFRTTYLRVKHIRTIWTIMGILALAMVMTPKFFPVANDQASVEFSQTIIKKQKEKVEKKAVDPSLCHRSQKIVQTRQKNKPPRPAPHRL